MDKSNMAERHNLPTYALAMYVKQWPLIIHGNDVKR